MRPPKHLQLIAWLGALAWASVNLTLPAMAQDNEAALYPSYYSQALKDGEIVLRILAIAAGGLWAYFKFLKGRTFYPRLEPEITGRLLPAGSAHALLARMRLKNAGLSRVDLDRENSGLRIFMGQADTSAEAGIMPWKHRSTIDVFEGHEWVEPGETIVDEQIVMVPTEGEMNQAVRLELKLASGSERWRSVAVTMEEKGLAMRKDPLRDLIRDSVTKQETAKPREDAQLRDEKRRTEKQPATSRNGETKADLPNKAK